MKRETRQRLFLILSAGLRSRSHKEPSVFGLLESEALEEKKTGAGATPKKNWPAPFFSYFFVNLSLLFTYIKQNK